MAAKQRVGKTSTIIRYINLSSFERKKIFSLLQNAETSGERGSTWREEEEEEGGGGRKGKAKMRRKVISYGTLSGWAADKTDQLDPRGPSQLAKI